MPLPFFYAASLNIFAFAGDIGSDAKLRLRTAMLQNVVHHLMIAVRGFDEKLRLALGIDALFQLFQPFDAFGGIDRQIAVKSKALPIESRRHHRKDNGRRTYQRNDFQFLALGNGDYIRAGVGHSGQPASDITPIEEPASKGSRYPEMASGDVCLFRG